MSGTTLHVGLSKVLPGSELAGRFANTNNSPYCDQSQCIVEPRPAILLDSTEHACKDFTMIHNSTHSASLQTLESSINSIVSAGS